MDKNNWYVLHVLTGSELDVKKCMQNLSFKAIVPRRKLKECKDGVWKEIERLLIPGYIFINADMTVEAYYKIQAAPGIINILRGASDFPELVTLDEMQLIFKLTRDDDLVGISDIFIDGDKVQVISGPLFGLEGNILKVDKRRFRAKVLFSLAGQEKTIELGINVLDKV